MIFRSREKPCHFLLDLIVKKSLSADEGKTPKEELPKTALG
jgi:hypothetical protein